jgi:uncharacterized protein
MLGFGLVKLLLTLALIAAVWYGAKWRARIRAHAELQRQQRKAMGHAFAGRSSARRFSARRSSERGRHAGAMEDVEDMVRCIRCGSYVPLRDPRSCGRADCPYPG